MKKMEVISTITSVVGMIMMVLGIVVQNDYTKNLEKKPQQDNTNINNIAASTNMIVKEGNKKEKKKNLLLTEVEMETAPASVIIPPRIEVYDGLTLEELSEKLNRHLGNDIIAGKGQLIAAECINRGVDPIVATSIILHETGCGSNCSNLARYCYNFGGQKGSPGCNGGAFKQFDSIDEGLVGMISNLQRNYYAMGLDTVEKIAPKYCEGNTWAGKINWFVNKIRNN